VLPSLSRASRDEFLAVRSLVDANRLAAARSRWSLEDSWRPASSALAYGAADAAVNDRQYAKAFRLYDRVLFCEPLTELNPEAQDSGAAALIDHGLRLAAAGDLAAAKTALESAEHDGESIESRYFLGVVELARGNVTDARAAWKAAIDCTGYAQSPDGWTLPRPQEAALQRYLGASGAPPP
jgi:tetratricopeptide (TPR) repeat protein